MDDRVGRSAPGAIQRADFGRVTVFFGDKNGKYPDGNQVMVRGADTLAAFDTPRVANRIGPEFDAARLVVMGHVHEDHMAGLHRLPRAEVHVHRADLPAAQSWDGLADAFGTPAELRAGMLAHLQSEFHYAPRPDAIGYDDGAVWELGQSRVRAWHTPGHTAGHCVLVVEPEGVAFIGDIDLSSFGPYYGDASSNLSDFRRTLAALPEIPARIWVTSHHRGVYTERERFLNDLAAFAAKFDQREQRLIEYLRDSPMTLPQLTGRRLLYPANHQWPGTDLIEARTISRHLDELIGKGRVRVDAEGVYRLA
jgi:glyoxylase-like metal-dependent hydrolase (beta-lactamase superfamily II)